MAKLRWPRAFTQPSHYILKSDTLFIAAATRFSHADTGLFNWIFESIVLTI